MKLKLTIFIWTLVFLGIGYDAFLVVKIFSDKPLTFSGIAQPINIYQGGTNARSFSPSSLIASGPTATSSLMATTSNPLTIGSIRATSTATSTFAGGIQFSNNANICTSAGICLGATGGGSSNWTDAGAYLTPLTLTDGIIISASSTFSSTLIASANFGVGTTTPGARLSVLGTVNATTDLVNVASSSNYVNFKIDNNGTTSISFLQTGLLQSVVDAGVFTLMDLPLGGCANNTVESYDMQLGASSTLAIWGQCNGSSQIKNKRVGVGTTTPSTELSVSGEGQSSTTLMLAGSTRQGSGVQLQSADGAWYCIYVANGGTLTTFVGACK